MNYFKTPLFSACFFPLTLSIPTYAAFSAFLFYNSHMDILRDVQNKQLELELESQCKLCLLYIIGCICLLKMSYLLFTYQHDIAHLRPAIVEAL